MENGYADGISRIEINSLWGRKHIVWNLRPDVNILSGVNGTGKSTILNNLCLNIATTTDVNSLYSTLEEHRDRVFVNLLNSFAKVPLGRNNREIIRKELRGIYTKEELNATKYSIKEKHDYMSFLENKKAQAEYLTKKSEFAKLIENSHRT